NTTYTKLMGFFGVENRDELLFMIGSGEIVPDDRAAKTVKGNVEGERRLFQKFLRATKNVLTLSTGKNEDRSERIGGVQENASEKEKINTKETYILRHDENGANFVLADCCSPMPGDEVLGFIDDDGKVVVHALNCPRALVLKAGYGPRIVSTKWAVSKGKFRGHIRVEGIDRHGILQEITGVISTQLAIDLRRLDIEANDEVFHCDLWVRVVDVDILNELCQRLREVKGVESATRIQ
ncbi:MAG: GTP pyrophosphokinase, partial [Muribaculaceae bacterium]|nr:GTP pyrophosphokinase [Muribaculaceae bacterium]